MLNVIEKFLASSSTKTERISDELNDLNIAMLATDGFEQSELFDPKDALESAGANVCIVSLKSGHIKSWKSKDWGKSIKVDYTLKEAEDISFDALVLPGGVINPDKLRIDQDAVAFVRKFVDQNLPIAAICHGPQTLIEVGAVKGRRMTSWPSLKTDLINAGANWVDEEVVIDSGLITSRKPSDIPAFNDAMIREFSKSYSTDIEAENSEPMADDDFMNQLG